MLPAASCYEQQGHQGQPPITQHLSTPAVTHAPSPRDPRSHCPSEPDGGHVWHRLSGIRAGKAHRDSKTPPDGPKVEVTTGPMRKGEVSALCTKRSWTPQSSPGMWLDQRPRGQGKVTGGAGGSAAKGSQHTRPRFQPQRHTQSMSPEGTSARCGRTVRANERDQGTPEVRPPGKHRELADPRAGGGKTVTTRHTLGALTEDFQSS